MTNPCLLAYTALFCECGEDWLVLVRCLILVYGAFLHLETTVMRYKKRGFSCKRQPFLFVKLRLRSPRYPGTSAVSVFSCDFCAFPEGLTAPAMWLRRHRLMFSVIVSVPLNSCLLRFCPPALIFLA